jgi:hypothetical protein
MLSIIALMAIQIDIPASTYLDGTIIIFTLQQQILWLQIPVCNTLGMTISNSLKQNLANIPRLLFIVKTLAHDPIKQFSPLHLLGNEVIVRWFLVDIVKTNNVFVFQFLEDINFIL